jgi:hypothetical protein
MPSPSPAPQPVILKTESIIIQLKEMTSNSENRTDLCSNIVKTFQIPYGSKNIQVTCKPNNISTMTFQKSWQPASRHLENKCDTNQSTDDSIYNMCSTQRVGITARLAQDTTRIETESFGKVIAIQFGIPSKEPNTIHDSFDLGTYENHDKSAHQ